MISAIHNQNTHTMTRAELKKLNIKHFGVDLFMVNHPNYSKWADEFLMLNPDPVEETEEQYDSNEKDYYTLGCDKYHAWKDDQL
jgi:hypothetical protein